MKRLCLIAILLTTSCAGASFSPSARQAVTTALFHYSPEFDAQVLAEEAALDKAAGRKLPPCGRTAPGPACSAVKAMIIDYGYDRDQDRRLGAQEQP